jgi:hypothetical protein
VCFILACLQLNSFRNNLGLDVSLFERLVRDGGLQVGLIHRLLDHEKWTDVP